MHAAHWPAFMPMQCVRCSWWQSPSNCIVQEGNEGCHSLYKTIIPPASNPVAATVPLCSRFI